MHLNGIDYAIVIAYFLSRSRVSIALLIGATVTGVFASFLIEFWNVFRKGPNMKTCKFHSKLQCILKVGQNKHT